MSNSGNTGDTIAAVMLGDQKMPADRTLSQAIRTRLPDVQLGESGTASLFAARGAACAIMRVQVPLPITRQDACFANAWFWPDAWNFLKNHKAHLLISVSGASDAKAAAIILQQLIAAVCETAPSALAVHCASSDGLLPANALPSAVPPRSNEIAIPLFVSTRIGRQAANPSAIFAKTNGLSAFGLSEIEVLDYEGNPTGLNETILDLANYLITAGPVLKDGDTVGPDDATKITVRHLASHFNAQEQVYRLQFGR